MGYKIKSVNREHLLLPAILQCVDIGDGEGEGTTLAVCLTRVGADMVVSALESVDAAAAKLVGEPDDYLSKMLSGPFGDLVDRHLPEKITRLERVVCSLLRATGITTTHPDNLVGYANQIVDGMDRREVESRGRIGYMSDETFARALEYALKTVSLETSQDYTFRDMARNIIEYLKMYR